MIKLTTAPSPEIATLRIELVDTDPPIWREVEIPTSITLKILHDVVQAAMGWFDYHLWEFRVGGKTYGLPMDEDWGTEPRQNAAKVILSEVLKPGRTVIGYTYDFGDDWAHKLIVSDIRAPAPGLFYPRFRAGERACPPEDCGGIPGFYDLLTARADPADPEHAEVLEWLGDYDPEILDDLPINYALGRIAFRRRPATKKRS
ncbi:MAG TPA: plasmid pRiA4b ORF-3 family protein [Phenylobacterium sp.]|jgi:hypothetical protein|nr:plasmid pRiA4b ORF-3 family protein [Phenylobacterium sp.]